MPSHLQLSVPSTDSDFYLLLTHVVLCILNILVCGHDLTFYNLSFVCMQRGVMGEDEVIHFHLLQFN